MPAGIDPLGVRSGALPRTLYAPESTAIGQAPEIPWRSLLIAVLAAFILAPPEPAAAAGQLDPTFNGDGKVRTEFDSTEDWANDVAVLENGKTVAVGVATPGGEIYEGPATLCSPSDVHARRPAGSDVQRRRQAQHQLSP